MLSEDARLVIKHARGLIEPRECWTRDASARMADGTAVLSVDERAVAWCATGAVRRASADLGMPGSAVSEALTALDLAVPDPYEVGDVGCVMDFNDRSSHFAVLGVFDLALRDGP